MRKNVFVLVVALFLSVTIYGQVAPVDSVAVSFIQPMTKTDFLNKVMDYDKNPETWVFKGKRPCVIDFYADWCGPCKIASPVLEELALEYQGKVDFYKVNIDKEKELAYVFGIQSIPSFLYCPVVGKPTKTMGVASDKKQIKQTFKSEIQKILSK